MSRGAQRSLAGTSSPPTQACQPLFQSEDWVVDDAGGELEARQPHVSILGRVPSEKTWLPITLPLFGFHSGLMNDL